MKQLSLPFAVTAEELAEELLNAQLCYRTRNTMRPSRLVHYIRKKGLKGWGIDKEHPHFITWCGRDV